MMYQYLIMGVLIGIVFGMPIGAVGALSMQRTIHQGAYAGLLTGVASSIADVLYACVGAFGLTFISNFLLTYQMPIHLSGAFLLVVIAIRIICKKESLTEGKEMDVKGYFKMFISSFAIAIMNPAAILSFLFAFSVFGIQGSLGLTNGMQVVVGVFLGTFLWWILLVVFTSFMKRKLSTAWYGKVNQVFGVILIVFSIAVIMKAL